MLYTVGSMSTGKAGRTTRRKLKASPVSIDCPVDLDSLILSDECSPEFLELNLSVNDDILRDAILWSACAGWLLKLDVFEKFTPEFRASLYGCLDAFSKMTRVYFIIQLQESGKDGIIDEFANWSAEHVLPDRDIHLFSPLSMLGNDVREQDLDILHGKLTLRKFLLDRIGLFLKTGNKDDVDFSCSLFLPQLLNPRFFKDIGEGEQIAILGNLDRYFKVMTKFATRNKGVSALWNVSQHCELNPPQALIKHILSGMHPYTHRVKMLAWKRLLKECATLFETHPGNKDCIWKVFSINAVSQDHQRLMEEKVVPSGYNEDDISKWISDAHGIFESFELDCTLHGLDATDFLVQLMCNNKTTFDLVDGLMNFQDDETRERLFKEVSVAMRIQR